MQDTPVVIRSELFERLGLGAMWITVYPPGYPRPPARPPDPNWKNPLTLLDEPRPRRVNRQGQRPTLAARKLAP